MRPLKRLFTAAVLTGSLVVAGLPARAEGLIRIVEQFGTLYLPLHVIRDQGLIEKYGKAEGLDIKVEWAKLSGGAAINEALLSGNVDVAAAGIGPFLTLWDKTGGSVKIIGALGAQPNYLVTNKPEIKTLKDFTAADKIALPAVGVSVQARLLQIAAEKEFGVGNHKQLDGLTVTLPHPDATAALLSGSTEITGHISNSPFQEQALASGKVHKVLSSYDILGGPATPTLVYTTIKFRAENPKTYKAFYDALPGGDGVDRRQQAGRRRDLRSDREVQARSGFRPRGAGKPGGAVHHGAAAHAGVRGLPLPHRRDQDGSEELDRLHLRGTARAVGELSRCCTRPQWRLPGPPRRPPSSRRRASSSTTPPTAARCGRWRTSASPSVRASGWC